MSILKGDTMKRVIVKTCPKTGKQFHVVQRNWPTLLLPITGLFSLAPPVLYVSMAWCALFLCVRLLEARDLRTR